MADIGVAAAAAAMAQTWDKQRVNYEAQWLCTDGTFVSTSRLLAGKQALIACTQVKLMLFGSHALRCHRHGPCPQQQRSARRRQAAPDC